MRTVSWLNRRTKEVPLPADGPSDGIYLTNRCGNKKVPGCGRFLTKLEILENMNNPRGICTCGASTFRASNAKWWEALFLWRSWRAWLAWKAGLLPPPPDKAWWDGQEAKTMSSMEKLYNEEENRDEDLDSVKDEDVVKMFKGDK